MEMVDPEDVGVLFVAVSAAAVVVVPVAAGVAASAAAKQAEWQRCR